MSASEPKISILTESCDACPFKGKFDGLRPGRLKDIIDETSSANDGAGSYFSCHKTIDYGLPEGERGDAVFHGAAVCAGWLEAVEKIRRVPQVIQIARRMGYVLLRKPYDRDDLTGPMNSARVELDADFTGEEE